MQSQQGARQEIVGVDIGGTFTDIVLSTPALSSSSESLPITLQRFWDLRYRGQSYELTTADAGNLQATLASFHILHQQRYGHSHPDQDIQLVAIRLKAIFQPAQPTLQLTAQKVPFKRGNTHQAKQG